MKKIMIVLIFLFFTEQSFALETKKVCIKDNKTGKQTCKMMKVHKKFKGVPVPKK